MQCCKTIERLFNRQLATFINHRCPNSGTLPIVRGWFAASPTPHSAARMYVTYIWSACGLHSNMVIHTAIWLPRPRVKTNQSILWLLHYVSTKHQATKSTEAFETRMWLLYIESHTPIIYLANLA